MRNSSQLWALCAKPLCLLFINGRYCHRTFIQGKPALSSMRQTSVWVRALFSGFSSLLPWLVSFSVFPTLTWSKLFCWLLPWHQHHLKPLISLAVAMLLLHAVLSQVPFHKPVDLLSRNYWSEDPSLRCFMERGQTRQLHRNRPTQTHVQSPEEEMCPTIEIHKQTYIYSYILIYSIVVWVHCWPKRCLKRIVFVLSYHPSLWTHL